MSKRTEKIILEVLERVSNVIGNRYRIDPTQVMDLIKDIPDSIHCTYVLTKGKRKGNVFNVALCPHHEQKSVGQEVLFETKENTPIYISDEELEYGDATLREIIAESIMYANVDKSRREQGIPPLGVTTHMLSSRSFDDVK